MQHEDAPERPAALRNLPNNVSNISMTVPTASIPHVASTSEELRKIFASDATPGGYNAAAKGPPKRPPPQGSLDLSFQFGSVGKPKKSAGRVEQITHHIKQKLSEGRLSKESTELLGASQRSTGLTELLTSRTGSEGGYDSDARSIQTPMLQSTSGTLRVSPAFARKSLKTILSESSQEPLQSQTEIADNKDSVSPSSRRPESKSSPLPMTPAKTSFTAAMQIAANESPSDALRRLSIGIANGTIKVPGTPELRALRLPSTSEVENEWRMSMRAPERVSSLSKCNVGTEATIKRLSDRIATAKRQSSKSSSGRGQHDSLISELDPTLLEYIERYADGQDLEHHSPISSPTTVIKIRDVGAVDDKHVDRNRLTSIAQSLANSMNDVSSASTSAEQSLHLFNMRISQRLASISRAPMLSSANSNNTSARSLATPPDLDTTCQSRKHSVSGYPTFIATEHNCHTSDLETEKRFENVPTTQSNSMDRKLVNLGSLDLTTNTQDRRPSITHDDTSSIYGSESGGQQSSSGFPAPTSRRSSLKNLHSLAIGGRSVSDAPPCRTSITSCVLNSINHVRTRQHRLDGLWETEGSLNIANTSANARNFSMPGERHLSDPDAKIQVPSQQTEDGTETNEDMSEISIEVVRVKRNENFSEAETGLYKMNERASNVSKQGDCGNSSKEISSASYHKPIEYNTTKTPYRLPVLTKYDQRMSLESPSERPMAMVKRRAARQQAQKLDDSQPLQPWLDRKRDLRASTRSVSDTGPPAALPETVTQRRSQSVDGDSSSVAMVKAKERLHRKSLPFLDLISSGPISNKAQTWIDRGKLKKKSILDVGRRFTAAGFPGEDKKAKKFTQVRNVLSIWTGFPSHTREQRNGTAADSNGVRARDFLHERCTGDETSTLANQSTASLTLRGPVSQRFLSIAESKLNRNKTKSLNFNTDLEARARRSRKGFVGRLRRLYRSSSSDLRAFANTHGHRSSISLGRGLEYPELECFPAERLLVQNQNNRQDGSTDVDGAADQPTGNFNKQTSQNDHNTQTSTCAYPSDWVDAYADCVGSFSALRSSSDIPREKPLEPSSTMRDSTEECKADLTEEAAEAKACLLRLAGKDDSHVSKVAQPDELCRLSIDLKIPGSFE